MFERSFAVLCVFLWTNIYICVGEGGQSKTLALLYIIYVECFDCTSKKIADCKVIQIKLDGEGHEGVLCVRG